MPRESLPTIWESSAELEAAYRFLRNPRTEFAALMEPVQQSAREMALEEGRVLVLHDTTDVTCPAAEPDEVGFLPTSKAGFYVHHALCVSAASPTKPMGMLWSHVYGRAQRSQGRSRRALCGPELAKLEDRESDRWLEGASEAHVWTLGCTEVVHVMDREADSFRVFEHMSELGANFVIRVRHDRITEDGPLSEVLSAAPVRLRREVELSPRKGKRMPRYTHEARRARTAELVVRCASVEIEPPRYLADSPPVRVNVLQVLEENPPEGEKPVAWVLATTLPIKTRADIERIIDIYRARWGVEEMHKALKTGCMLEKRQLESFESITTLLALSYPVACELLRLRARTRTEDVPATALFRPSLIACLRAHPSARRLSSAPTGRQVLEVIAGLGGHQKANGPPGWKTLATGYTKILAFEAGWLAAIASQTCDQ